jgi:hypothetical protein
VDTVVRGGGGRMSMVGPSELFDRSDGAIRDVDVVAVEFRERGMDNDKTIAKLSSKN